MNCPHSSGGYLFVYFADNFKREENKESYELIPLLLDKRIFILFLCLL